jgi:hypothetical protein
LQSGTDGEGALERHELEYGSPLPISVSTEDGQTKIGMIRPEQILASLSQEKALSVVAEDVEAKTIQMIEEAK